MNWDPLPRHLRLRDPPSLRYGETGAYGGQVGRYNVKRGSIWLVPRSRAC